MVEIDAGRVTPRLTALFDPGEPAGLRCFAVLEGTAAGRILTDDAASPTWGAVREAGNGTMYLGGTLDAPVLGRIVADLRQQGDVLVGLWPDDERLALLPPDPDYDGFTLDFTERASDRPGEDLRRVPPGCQARRMDRELLARTADGDYYAAIFGGAEQALQKGLGLCLVRDNEILCEAFAGPAALGLIEIATATHEPHRGRGYATVTCARLIDACDALGYRTYWNCAKQNVASAALARKLGFGTGREYKLLAWFKSPS